MTQIRLIPSCQNTNTGCSGGADPGVVELQGPFSGGAQCAGVGFSTAVVNAMTGEVEFTPMAPGAVPPLAKGESCSITFSVKVLKFPSGDANPFNPGVQTAQLGSVVATHSGGGAAPGAGTAFFTVEKAATSIVTQASPQTVDEGGSFSDTATLSGGVNPTGTITFRLFKNDAACMPASEVAGAAASFGVNGNGTYGPATFTTSASDPTKGPGTYRWVVTYDGDANNAGFTTACTDPAEQVVVRDLLPSITVTKAASAAQDEPGGTFTFTVMIRNNSSVEPLTITAISDDTYNATGPGSTCTALLNTTLAAGATVSCTFPGTFTNSVGNPKSQPDTVSVTVKDDENNQPTATASATATINDVPPASRSPSRPTPPPSTSSRRRARTSPSRSPSPTRAPSTRDDHHLPRRRRLRRPGHPSRPQQLPRPHRDDHRCRRAPELVQLHGTGVRQRRGGQEGHRHRQGPRRRHAQRGERHRLRPGHPARRGARLHRHQDPQPLDGEGAGRHRRVHGGRHQQEHRRPVDDHRPLRRRLRQPRRPGHLRHRGGDSRGQELHLQVLRPGHRQRRGRQDRHRERHGQGRRSRDRGADPHGLGHGAGHQRGAHHRGGEDRQPPHGQRAGRTGELRGGCHQHQPRGGDPHQARGRRLRPPRRQGHLRHRRDHPGERGHLHLLVHRRRGGQRRRGQDRHGDRPGPRRRRLPVEPGYGRRHGHHPRRDAHAHGGEVGRSAGQA